LEKQSNNRFSILCRYRRISLSRVSNQARESIVDNARCFPNVAKAGINKTGIRKQDYANLHVIPRWSIDQMAVLEEELEKFRPDLVVIDSLKKITAGKRISENSAEFADNIIALNDMLSRYRAAGILVHHANKGNDAIGVEQFRGSTAIVGRLLGYLDATTHPETRPQ
jgi:RecA-family ATPase